MLSYYLNDEKRYFNNMVTLDKYIKIIREKGKSYFTKDQALKDLQIKNDSLNARIYRLKQKSEIISPAENLYVIVPPEYRNFGCIPAEELVPLLMKYKKVDYYACLLTAAMYHEASHQKPQLFQVMTNKQLKPLSFGKVRIEFIYKKFFVNLPTQNINVKTGYLKISSPELTAMDLLLYSKHSGGLNHIAGVLSELVEAINPEKLTAVTKVSGEKTWLQRLGYILDHINSVNNKKKKLIISKLKKLLGRQKLVYMPLASELPVKGCSRNDKWMIIENTTIESDYDS